jgi:hypothetical protein
LNLSFINKSISVKELEEERGVLNDLANEILGLLDINDAT